MFTVKGYLNGISYAVQVGVSPERANDGIVAGDPRVVGMLQTLEGLPITLGPGKRSVKGSNENPDWVLAALHEHTQVTDVDSDGASELPDLRVTRTRRPAGAVY